MSFSALPFLFVLVLLVAYLKLGRYWDLELLNKIPSEPLIGMYALCGGFNMCKHLVAGFTLVPHSISWVHAARRPAFSSLLRILWVRASPPSVYWPSGVRLLYSGLSSLVGLLFGISHPFFKAQCSFG